MAKQSDPMPLFLTLQQAAQIVDVPADRLLKMIHRKELPDLLVGVKWRIPKTALTKLSTLSI
jgi:excisionase family DNA binding protein